jgi:HAD superfamily hydrolase (TIGR01509 family)
MGCLHLVFHLRRKVGHGITPKVIFTQGTLMIRALVFDFDGLILDTETPEFIVWQEIFRDYGQEIRLEDWGRIIGGYGISDYDPARHLAELVGDSLTPQALTERHHAETNRRILRQPIMPGVLDYLKAAPRLGLRLAIASSSPHFWVDGHLTRLGLFDHFQHIVCREDVPPGRTKPHPDLFLKAITALSAQPGEAIIFEDSPNGVRAALTAGAHVVAVPNPLTKQLAFETPSLMLDALADLPLERLIAQFN